MPKNDDSPIDRLPLDAIRTHLRLQPRGGTDYRTTRRYANIMRQGNEMTPIDVGRIGKALYVIDGHHRLEAAALVGLGSIRAKVQRYRTLDDAQLAALQCNGGHGRSLTNKEKANALRSYVDSGLHLHGSDTLDGVPGTIKSLRLIATECPVYSFQNIGRKLKEWGIEAPRDDVKPFDPNRREEWDGPSADEIAEDDQIALKSLQDHLRSAQEAWAMLQPESRDVGTAAFRDALNAIQPPNLTGPRLLEI